MENPKIRIESDGRTARVCLDGEEIKTTTLIDFSFHADADDGIRIQWDGMFNKTNEHGVCYAIGDEIAAESFHYDSKEAER